MAAFFGVSFLFLQIISAIAASAVWKIIFKNDGILNGMVEFLGGMGLNWLGDKNLAFICISIVSIWKSVGYFLIIYYAGIMGVSRDQHEAAIVDGATTMKLILVYYSAKCEADYIYGYYIKRYMVFPNV